MTTSHYLFQLTVYDIYYFASSPCQGLRSDCLLSRLARRLCTRLPHSKPQCLAKIELWMLYQPCKVVSMIKAAEMLAIMEVMEVMEDSRMIIERLRAKMKVNYMS